MTYFQIILNSIAIGALLGTVQGCYVCRPPYCFQPEKADSIEGPTAYIRDTEQCANVSQAEFLCIVYGNPAPDVTWYKMPADPKNSLGVPSPIDPKGTGVHYENIPGGSKLIFSNPTEADAGEYKCIAKNIHNTAEDVKAIKFTDCSKQVKIVMQTSSGETMEKTYTFKAPEFEVEPWEVPVKVGSSIALECQAVGFDLSKAGISTSDVHPPYWLESFARPRGVDLVFKTQFEVGIREFPPIMTRLRCMWGNSIKQVEATVILRPDFGTMDKSTQTEEN